MNTLSELISPQLLNAFWDILLTIIVFFVGRWLISKLLDKVDLLAQRTGMDPGLRKFLHALSTVGGYMLLAYIIADLFGVPTASFVALLGSVGVTIGLALQGSLSNFASGVLLLLLRPFRVGDYICCGGVDGNVDAVGLFYTTVISLNNQVISVPNSTLTASSIINYSMLPERRIDLTVSVGYGEDLSKAKTLLLRLVAAREKILASPEPLVFVAELGEYSISLGLRCWTKTADYWNELWALNEQIKLAFDQNGITIPYRQLDVHINDGQAPHVDAAEPVGRRANG